MGRKNKPTSPPPLPQPGEANKSYSRAQSVFSSSRAPSVRENALAVAQLSGRSLDMLADHKDFDEVLKGAQKAVLDATAAAKVARADITSIQNIWIALCSTSLNSFCVFERSI